LKSKVKEEILVILQIRKLQKVVLKIIVRGLTVARQNCQSCCTHLEIKERRLFQNKPAAKMRLAAMLGELQRFSVPLILPKFVTRQ